MSAFVVAKSHIDALVRVAVQGPAEYCPNPGSPWRFCDALRDNLIDRLPGYDEADWEITD